MLNQKELEAMQGRIHRVLTKGFGTKNFTMTSIALNEQNNPVICIGVSSTEKKITDAILAKLEKKGVVDSSNREYIAFEARSIIAVIPRYEVVKEVKQPNSSCFFASKKKLSDQDESNKTSGKNVNCTVV